MRGGCPALACACISASSKLRFAIISMVHNECDDYVGNEEGVSKRGCIWSVTTELSKQENGLRKRILLYCTKYDRNERMYVWWSRDELWSSALKAESKIEKLDREIEMEIAILRRLLLNNLRFCLGSTYIYIYIYVCTVWTPAHTIHIYSPFFACHGRSAADIT